MTEVVDIISMYKSIFILLKDSYKFDIKATYKVDYVKYIIYDIDASDVDYNLIETYVIPMIYHLYDKSYLSYIYCLKNSIYSIRYVIQIYRLFIKYLNCVYNEIFECIRKSSKHIKNIEVSVRSTVCNHYIFRILTNYCKFNNIKSRRRLKINYRDVLLRERVETVKISIDNMIISSMINCLLNSIIKLPNLYMIILKINYAAIKYLKNSLNLSKMYDIIIHVVQENNQKNRKDVMGCKFISSIKHKNKMRYMYKNFI